MKISSDWKESELEYICRVGGKVPAPVIARALNKPLNALIKKSGDMGISLTVPKSRLDKHWPEYSGGGNG